MCQLNEFEIISGVVSVFLRESERISGVSGIALFFKDGCKSRGPFLEELERIWGNSGVFFPKI